MPDAKHDSKENVINRQIMHEISIMLAADCLTGAVKLIYCGIDAMAFLGLPETKNNVSRKNFIDWCERYIRFPCEAQLTGKDLYGARCGVLHQHGPESQLNRDGECRQLHYCDRLIPEVLPHPKYPLLVMVSVPALAKAFSDGVNQYFQFLYAEPKRRRLSEERLRKMLNDLPVGGSSDIDG